MASPADPASTGKAKVGKPSTTEARAAALSLTCGAAGDPAASPEEVSSVPAGQRAYTSSSCSSRCSTTFFFGPALCGGGLLRRPLRPTAARDATEHAVVADAALQQLHMASTAGGSVQFNTDGQPEENALVVVVVRTRCYNGVFLKTTARMHLFRVAVAG